ncbi:MAG TPA: NAD(+) synthase [Chloroflexota bacterium]|nr:NAD(+) synthase [Chloroflexota bacterium]
MVPSIEFESIYSHGFLRVAVCLPEVRVATPRFNTERTIALARRASNQHAALALFPELGLSAYTNEDLFHQDALIDASLEGLREVVEASRELTPLLLVGLPLRIEGQLFNAAAAVYRGRLLGLTPKTYLPNYREFYERRQFTPAGACTVQRARILGQDVPVGNDLVFRAANHRGFAVHAEICEDVWVPLPPSTTAAMAGATVLCNLSASNITVGKAEYRKLLCASQSARCFAAYLYAAAGPGESSTDLGWDGHALACENGDVLGESQRFSDQEQILFADIDLDRLLQERMASTSFNDCVGTFASQVRSIRQVEFDFEGPRGRVPLERAVERFPYVPADATERDARCYEAYNIQVQALEKRLSFTHSKHLIIGVSGGLDSTQALMVAAKAFDRLGRPRSDILAYTMPGFATSSHTKNNAWELMRVLGVSAAEIDIRPSCMQMLKDIDHPFAKGEPVYDIAFENVQAGERTSHLFRLANRYGGFVLGTGDLSELALGWCTYGVGDQMSHYNVNASVPKTLIQYLLRWVVATAQFDERTNAVLTSIIDTEISPELIPGGEEDEHPAQSTEQIVGPYELQDFNLYYTTRHGFRPSKVAFLSHHAWGDRARGSWPDTYPETKRQSYDLATICRWLDVFLYRFFQTSQYKRSAMPNGPKVGSGGSLSPRGDWRAPSDAEAEVWLRELRENTPAEAWAQRATVEPLPAPAS